jgi:hypothetical protein
LFQQSLANPPCLSVCAERIEPPGQQASYRTTWYVCKANLPTTVIL